MPILCSSSDLLTLFLVDVISKARLTHLLSPSPRQTSCNSIPPPCSYVTTKTPLRMDAFFTLFVLVLTAGGREERSKALTSQRLSVTGVSLLSEPAALSSPLCFPLTVHLLPEASLLPLVSLADLSGRASWWKRTLVPLPDLVEIAQWNGVLVVSEMRTLKRRKWSFLLHGDLFSSLLAL